MGLPSDVSGLTGWWTADQHYRNDGVTLCSGNPDSVWFWKNNPTYGTKTFNSGAAYQHYDGNYVGARNGNPMSYDTQTLTGYGVCTGWTPNDVITATAGTVFCVGSPAANDGFNTSFRAWYMTSNSNAGAYPYYNTATNAFVSAINDTTFTTKLATLTFGASQLGTWGIHTWMLDVAGAGKLYCGWNDTRTAQMANVVTPTGINSDAMANFVYVNYVAGAYMNGYIGELIMYNRALTEAERLTVEGYLATKWAIILPYGAGVNLFW